MGTTTGKVYGPYPPSLATCGTGLVQPPNEAHTTGLIAILWAENRRLRQENEVLRQEKEALSARLALEIAKRFGRSSERRPRSKDAKPAEGACDTSAVSGLQEAVPAEGSQAPISPIVAEAETTGEVSEQRKRGGQPGHKGYGRHTPKGLPREEHEHVLSESERTCPTCGLPYAETGLKDTSEEVDVQVKIVVLRHIRKWYRATCACPAVAQLLAAPLPPKLIAKGKFTVQTWVKFLLDKYLAQIPVHRQLLLLKMAGLPVSKGTVHGGFDRLYDDLIPLYEHFLAHLRQMEHIHADETRWMIFEEIPGKANHRWWLWLFASADVICLVVDPSRSAAVPFKTLSEPLSPDDPAPSVLDPGCVTREIGDQTYVLTPHLKSISADRYPVYPSLSPNIHVAFCWAHQRRDFTDFQTAHAQQADQVAWAAQWIATIAQLYALNSHRLAVLDDPQAFPTAQTALEQAIASVAQQLTVRSELPASQRKILDSMHNHWAGLIFFLSHPAIPMDNNWSERLIRMPVVGRKNYIGHQSQRAGNMGAILFSIILTCQLHDVSPFDFLVRYFNACAVLHAPPSDLTPFCPWLKPALPIPLPASP